MREPKDDAEFIEHLDKSRGLRLVHCEKHESLLPDPELKILIEKIKGKPKRIRLRGDDGPEAA